MTNFGLEDSKVIVVPSLADGTAKIDSRADFVRFLDSLYKDFLEHGSDWENPTLERFLEALRAWCNDCPGYYRNVHDAEIDPDVPQWRVFADMLLAASVYE